MENSSSPERSSAERVLGLLKTRGPQTAATLGEALRISGEAVRQQLARLAGEGLVDASAEPAGVGRPARVWRLTDAGHRRFPDRHAELAAQLLTSIRRELGEEALGVVLAARERDVRAAYESELRGAATLGERVARLAEIRTREGYMAEWREEGPGAFLLIENHCPIGAAATVCQGFCGVELDVFRAVLGRDATVERAEHIPTGTRRCVYRITSAAPAPRRATAGRRRRHQDR
ncbi:MAG TPA: metalloregulator ArsR/SmtB family transcription factor [Gemmatimonadaceae bacterium]|nr:metalloregulator ArsR/SmtB family transcription factor [Gemmatimonadaceae bacterium]